MSVKDQKNCLKKQLSNWLQPKKGRCFDLLLFNHPAMGSFSLNAVGCQCGNSCFQRRNTFPKMLSLLGKNHGRLLDWVFWCWARIHTHLFVWQNRNQSRNSRQFVPRALGLPKWMKYRSIRARKWRTKSKKWQTRIIWKHHPPISLKKTLSLKIKKITTSIFVS